MNFEDLTDAENVQETPEMEQARLLRELEALTEKDIEQTYNGKSHTCYCGCAGNYVSSSANPEAKEDADEISDSTVRLRLSRMVRNAKSGSKISKIDADGRTFGDGDIYIVETNGRDLAAYCLPKEVA